MNDPLKNTVLAPRPLDISFLTGSSDHLFYAGFGLSFLSILAIPIGLI